METKRCADCEQYKPLDRFGSYNSWYCKDCLNRRQREFQRRKRERYLALHPKVEKPPVTEKTCRVCGEIKPVDQFNWANRDKGVRSSYCKPCQGKRAYQDQIRRGYADEKLRYKCTKLGTTPEWFHGKLDEQNQVCAICLSPETHKIFQGSDKVRSLAIDHDHATGKVRGLLCFRCNTALHQLEKHGRKWAHRAVAYLDAYERET